MSTPDFSKPSHVIAVGLAVGAVLYGLSFVVVAVFEGIGVLSKAIAASAGLVVAVATTGFATAGTVATWLAPVSAAGLAATGVATTYLVVAKIIERGREKPYEWLLPALGLLAVFFVDLSKEDLGLTGTQRALYALSTGLLTIGGGFLLMQQKLAVRAIGFFLPFLPFVAVMLLLLQANHIPMAISDFIRSGSTGAIGLIGVFILGLLTAVLGILLPVHAEQDG